MNQTCQIETNERISVPQRVIRAILLGVLLYVIFLLLSEFQIVPSLSTATLTLPFAFFLGILASVSTCMATAGALFLATIGTLKTDRLIPTITFNIGRVGAYALSGFLLGLLGQIVSVNYNGSVILTVFVSSIMVLIGLEMLGIIPFSSLFSRHPLTKQLWSIEGTLAKKPKKTAFFLGLLTYFLPCGFSQTVQLFALSTGDPAYSALIMTVFALGTVPTLFALSVTSLFTRTAWYPWFMHAVAVLIVMVGAGYVFNTLQLYTHDVIALDRYEKVEGDVVIEEGTQIVRMDVIDGGYSPNTFAIRKSMPVKWIVNGINVYGCQGFLNVPKLGIQQPLKQGENVFEFTPETSGMIAFSCSTNATQGSFVVM